MRLDVLTEVTDGGSTVHLLARLSAEARAASERPPVNLTLVLDRSSSMRGPRLAQAVRAASQVIDRLEPRDRLAVVVFDAGARVLFGPEGPSDAGKDKLLRALAALDTGVGTNLAAGIKLGADKIRSGYVRGALSRLILLTDGQPSVGVTEPERLSALAAVEGASGVPITCMGIGDGFEEELLADMARRAGGAFYYLAGPADIPAAFGRELSGLFAIAATGAELKLVPDDPITSVDLLHRLPSRPVEDGLVVDVGEVAAGEPRLILFRLARDTRADSRHLATLRLSYRTADGKPGDGAITGVELPRLPVSEGARTVLIERLRLACAAAVDLAWARRAAGDRDVAAAGLDDVRRQVSAARAASGAGAEDLDAMLSDLAEAEGAVRSSAAERERIRRRLKERNQVTLLGHSTLVRAPFDDD